jgi:hypothetical protein
MTYPHVQISRNAIANLQVTPLRSSRAVVEGARDGSAISLARYPVAQILALTAGVYRCHPSDHDTVLVAHAFMG